MVIEKTKRKGARCYRCGKSINLKYRAVYHSNYYHLSCLKTWIENNIKRFQLNIKEFKQPKYKRIMVLENLE